MGLEFSPTPAIGVSEWIPTPAHRIRVIGAIEGGMSRNGAARRFGVSIASAVRWMDEYLRCGRTAPKPRGGDRRSGRIEAQADLLMRAIVTSR